MGGWVGGIGRGMGVGGYLGGWDVRDRMEGWDGGMGWKRDGSCGVNPCSGGL